MGPPKKKTSNEKIGSVPPIFGLPDVPLTEDQKACGVDAVYPLKAKTNNVARMRQKFLSQRPRHEYVTEIRKEEKLLEEKQQDKKKPAEKTPGAADQKTTKTAAVPIGTTTTKASEESLTAVILPAVDAGKADKEKPTKKVLARPAKKKGNRADNPLVNSVPFWFTTKEQGDNEEDDTEVENSIDLDFIQSVLEGGVTLRPNPIPKNAPLDPLGSITAIKNYCAHYNEDNVIQATVLNTVIEDVEQLETPNSRTALQILWDKKVKVVELDVITREIIGHGTRAFIEPTTTSKKKATKVK